MCENNKANFCMAPYTWGLAALASATICAFVLFTQDIANSEPNALGVLIVDVWVKFQPAAYLALSGFLLSLVILVASLMRRSWSPSAVAFLVFFSGLMVTAFQVWEWQGALATIPEEVLPEIAGVGLRLALEPFKWTLVALVVFLSCLSLLRVYQIKKGTGEGMST